MVWQLKDLLRNVRETRPIEIHLDQIKTEEEAKEADVPHCGDDASDVHAMIIFSLSAPTHPQLNAILAVDRVTFRRLAKNGKQPTRLNLHNHLHQHPRYPHRCSSWPLDMMAQQIPQRRFLTLMELHQPAGALSPLHPMLALSILCPVGLLQRCLCD